MVSKKFRQQLHQEVEQWKIEKLIDARLYEQLAQRYEFKNLDTFASNNFVMILIGLGSILLGLAAITFVAANWQIWSRDLKVFLLISVFIGVNVAGFYLWRVGDDNWQKRLGQGLLLLGAFLLGANMALMSQMFHQSGSIYELYFIWGLGVLAMAYSLKLTSLGILSIILTGIGCVIGIAESWWLESNFSGFKLVLENAPLAIALLYIPLAYRCRSRWLFGLSAFLVIYTFVANLSFLLARFSGLNEVFVAIACCLSALLLWAYSDRLWTRNRNTQILFDPIAHNLAIVDLSILFYWFSFHWFWDERLNSTKEQISLFKLIDVVIQISWFQFINVVIFVALTIYAWWRLGCQNNTFWRIDRQSSSIAAASIVSAGLFWWQFNVGALGAIATLIFNIFLFLLAIELIRKALATGKRRGFWSGIILLVLQIASRMLEYDTGLILKAIVLFVCGIGIIFAGLWFERLRRS